ncbi:AMP-binding protein [uncultured Roseivirga sp.]|uniref:AMP-binding protein n=1 Tax=uncultured Roseivirga sp. TaxID=543088 RepID=UPI000D7A94BD|nr:AMP-binding protein [uncultured Roseivirga sp.]PWL32053.1 MAG: AMP-dependent synthetase [Roseivirga sp. XM-24bin3]
MEKFSSALEAFSYWAKKNPNQVFLRQPINRSFIEYTYKDADVEIRKMVSGLKNLGIQPGDHIAILSKNCAHWMMADLAIMAAGCISIPIYPTFGAETIFEILEHSESKAIIVGKLDDYAAQQSGIPDIIKIGVEMYGVVEEQTWEKILAQNEPSEQIHTPQPEDLMTIMYTSGTTGNPKGVMHTYAAFDQLINTAIDQIKMPPNPRYFSYLPMTHIAERAGIELSSIFRGGTVSFPESLETFAEDLSSVQPQTFFGVPRIWQKFQEKILEKMPQKKLDKLLGLPLIGSLVKKKIQKKLGLSASVVNFSGAAPIAMSLQQWYRKLGIEINQAYGMTEDCILSHFNLPGKNKFGTVGRPLPGVTSKLSADGEILIKSNCIMKGYYKEPEKTAEIFTEDGFLRTGDIGEFDHDGYLSITGRVKDQFKTDKGKYISPAPIELEILKNNDVDQVCIVGSGIPQPIALVVPSEIGKKKSREEFNQSIWKTITDINPSLEAYEKVAKAVVMKEVWSVENGLMTPSLKVKRNRVEAIHTPMYPEWFKQDVNVVYEN